MSTHYPPAVIAAIRAELAGNTRHDLITWARRVLRNPPTKAELARAKLVMAIDEGQGTSMSTTKTIAQHANGTRTTTENNMKTIYIQDQDLDATANLRNLPTPQVGKPDAPRLQQLRPQAGLGVLPTAPLVQPPRQSAPERAGQTSGMARKSRCTPACTGVGCMSAQMDFAREVAGVSA